MSSLCSPFTPQEIRSLLKTRVLRCGEKRNLPPYLTTHWLTIITTMKEGRKKGRDGSKVGRIIADPLVHQKHSAPKRSGPAPFLEAQTLPFLPGLGCCLTLSLAAFLGSSSHQPLQAGCHRRCQSFEPHVESKNISVCCCHSWVWQHRLCPAPSRSSSARSSCSTDSSVAPHFNGLESIHVGLV